MVRRAQWSEGFSYKDSDGTALGSWGLRLCPAALLCACGVKTGMDAIE